MDPKRLENLLKANNDGGLGDIVRRARDMGHLVEKLQMSLPRDEAQGVVAANIRENGELVVMVSSPVWASRLRFESETLLSAARATGADVTSCSVRVIRD